MAEQDLQFDPNTYLSLMAAKRQAQTQNNYAPVQSANQAAQTVGGLGQDLQAMQEKRKQDQMKQMLLQQKQQQQTQQQGIEQQKANSDYGQPINPNQMDVNPNNPSGMPPQNGAPNPTPILGKSSFMPGGQGQVASPSPLIDRFKQWQSQGMPKQSAEPSFMPALSKDERTDYQKANAPMTQYQQAEIGVRNKEASMKTMGASDKSDQKDKVRWDKIVQENDPYKASSRSPIGIARIGNLKADHVIPLLQNPNATNQDINAAIAGLDTVLQGGAATESGIHSQQYETLASRFANLQTLITSKPAAVATPEVKQHLIDLMTSLKQTNNQLMKDHMDYVESSEPDLIQKNSMAWKNMRKRAGVDDPQNLPQSSQPQGGLMWKGKQIKDTPANRAWLQQQQGGQQ